MIESLRNLIATLNRKLALWRRGKWLVAVYCASGNGREDPGHMIAGDETEDLGQRAFCGFRFDPDDMPAEFREPKTWRSYLFDFHVPGHIVDESQYVRLIHTTGRKTYKKRVFSKRPLRKVLPPARYWRNYARYSFNPDDVDCGGLPCYNCVTWATSVANLAVPNMLLPVRNGRVKLVIEQLEGN